MELRQRIAAARGTNLVAEKDPFADVKDRIHGALIAQLGPVLATAEVDGAQVRDRVREEVRSYLALERGLAVADRERLVDEITDDTLGHGPLEKLLADDSVSEIMVNGASEVWIERKGRLYDTNIRF